MTKEREAESTKYKKLHLSVEQRLAFTNKEKAPLEAKVENVSQERNACVAKAEQFSLEVQCVPGLAEKAKKMRERVLALETAMRAKVSKCGKSPPKRPKQKKDDIEAEVAQTRVELNAWNARVAELEAHATELEVQME